MGDLFDIVRIPYFNKDELTPGDDYDYITRTSLNQGILKKTGFINKKNLNEENVWSLGLLQMDFFYRKRKWYAGQFVRKIVPKFNITSNNAKFFSGILNKLKPILLQVLVRNVDETFKRQIIKLPTKNNQIDFEFMESFIAELEAKYITKLKSYLQATESENYKLTKDEQNLINYRPNYQLFNLSSNYIMRGKIIHVDDKGLFNITPTKKKINANDVSFDGHFPYVARGESKNGIRGHIDFDVTYLNPENTISFGQDTATMYYQPDKYFTGDKIQVLQLNDQYGSLTEDIALFIISSMKKSFSSYEWGQKSFALDTIAEIPVKLPVDNSGNIDFNYIESYIKVLKKSIIASAVQYVNNKTPD